MKTFLFLLIAVSLSLPAAAEEVKMRDIFAGMPDSILPLITKNNRLDCIDFIENNMPARVKNVVDEPIELLRLTDNYLKFTMSKVSYAEMKLMKHRDGRWLICVVKTYSGPVADSSVRFYNTDWSLDSSLECSVPEVESFFSGVPETEQARYREVVAQLKDMPFIVIAPNADDEGLTFTLQTGELPQKDREWAGRFIKPIKKNAL